MSELRDELRESIAQMNSGDVVSADAGQVSDSGSVPSVSGAGESDSLAGKTADDSGPAVSAPVPTDAQGSDGRARDASGKFVPRPKPADAARAEATSPPKQGEGTQTKVPVVTPAVPSVAAPPTPGEASPTKAPQSWKASTREHWSKLPPEVQQEVARRERETAVALQETAPIKKFHQDFQQTIAPYAQMMRAEGMDPMKAVGETLQVANAFRTAPPHHVATIFATLVKQFGTGRFGPQFIDTLAEALDGKQPQGQGQPHQAVDPAQIAAQVRQQLMQDMAAQREQAMTQRSAREVEDFGANREFFEDVREDMADLLAGAARRGVAMTIEDAYNRALKLNDEASKVIQQREQAKLAETAKAATQRANLASSSVKSQPAGANGVTKADSLRGQLRESIAELTGRT